MQAATPIRLAQPSLSHDHPGQHRGQPNATGLAQGQHRTQTALAAQMKTAAVYRLPAHHKSPNPASVEAQAPDVGPERGSAVMGGGRR